MGFPLKIMLGERDQSFLSQLKKVEDLKTEIEQLDREFNLVNSSLIENFCVPLVIAHVQLAIIRKLSQQPENQRNYDVIPRSFHEAVPKVIRKCLGDWVFLDDLEEPQVQGQENSSIIRAVEEILDFPSAPSEKKQPPKPADVVEQRHSERGEGIVLKFQEKKPREEDLERALSHAKSEINRLTFRRVNTPISIGLIWSVGSVKKENKPKKEEEHEPIEEEITPALNLPERSLNLLQAITERGKKVFELRQNKQKLVQQTQELAERLFSAEQKLKDSPHSHFFSAGIFRNKLHVLISMRNQLIVGLENGTICFFNPHSKDKHQFLEERQLRPITALAVDNPSEKLVSGNDQGTISIWDIQNKKRLRSFTRASGMITLLKFIRFLGHEALVVGTNQGRLFFWNIGDDTVLADFKGSIQVDAYIMSQLKGEVLACEFFKNSIQIWSLIQSPKAPTLSHESKPRTELPVLLESEKKGKKSDNDFALSPTKEVVWPEKTEKKLLSSSTIKAHSLVLINDKTAAAGCSDGMLYMWNIETHEELKRIEGTKPIMGLSCFNRENKLVVLYEGGIIRIFNLASWEEFAQVDLGMGSKSSFHEDKQFFSNLAFYDEGKKLALRYMDQTLLLWDLEEIQKK